MKGYNEDFEDVKLISEFLKQLAAIKQINK